MTGNKPRAYVMSEIAFGVFFDTWCNREGEAMFLSQGAARLMHSQHKMLSWVMTRSVSDD